MHHSAHKAPSFVATKLDEVAAPSIRTERVANLDHVLDNIFDHHSAEDTKVEEKPPTPPMFDALGHRIRKKKGVEDEGPPSNYKRTGGGKDVFKQMKEIMPETHKFDLDAGVP